MKYLIPLLFCLVLKTNIGISAQNQRSRDFTQTIFKNKLKKLKYYLLTGKPTMAHAVLNTSSDLFQEAKLYNYYKSIIYFLSENYFLSKKFLKNFYSTNENSEKVKCTIDVLNSLENKEFKNLFNKWRNCSNTLSESNSLASTYMDFISQALSINSKKVFSESTFHYISNSKEELKSWLLASSKLKKSKDTEPYLLNLPRKIYQSEGLQNIITKTFLESGQITLAKESSKNISKKDQEILKANFQILKKDHLNAYNTYKGLKNIKDLSNQELSKFLILSFINSDYSNYINLIKRFERRTSKVPLEFLWKKVLSLLFLGKTIKAKQNLNQYILKVNNLGLSNLYKIRQIIAINESDDIESEYYAHKNCQAGDDASCWIILQKKLRFNPEKSALVTNSIQDLLNDNSLKEKSKNLKSNKENQRLFFY